MEKKPPTAKYLLRRVKVYKDRYEAVVTSRRLLVEQTKKYRAQLQQIVEHTLRDLRVATEELGRSRNTLASNAMTIQELNDQLAVQWKLAAEARSDVAGYKKQADEATKKHAEIVKQHDSTRQCLRAMEYKVDTQVAIIKQLDGMLEEALLSFRYRLWQRLRLLCSSVAFYTRYLVRSRTARLRNWFVVRRLNKARVTAMSEAGYIPEKLIKIAHKYWEMDQERMREGVIEYLDKEPGHKTVRYSLWRRFRIWMGRA